MEQAVDNRMETQTVKKIMESHTVENVMKAQYPTTINAPSLAEINVELILDTVVNIKGVSGVVDNEFKRKLASLKLAK